MTKPGRRGKCIMRDNERRWCSTEDRKRKSSPGAEKY